MSRLLDYSDLQDALNRARDALREQALPFVAVQLNISVRGPDDLLEAQKGLSVVHKLMRLRPPDPQVVHRVAPSLNYLHALVASLEHRQRSE